MNRIDKRHQQSSTASRWSGSPPGRWRIGKASVSTEELQAWQLGPAHVEYCFAADGLPRGREGRR